MVSFKVSENSPQLGDQWKVSNKFLSNGRIVDEHGKIAPTGYQGKRYKLYSKHEREYSILERVGRVSLGIFITGITCFTALLFKPVRNLYSKNKQTMRFATSNLLPNPINAGLKPELSQERMVEVKENLAREIKGLETEIRLKAKENGAELNPPIVDKVRLEKAREWLKLKPEEMTLEKAIEYSENSKKYVDDDYFIPNGIGFTLITYQCKKIIQEEEILRPKARAAIQDTIDLTHAYAFSDQLKDAFYQSTKNLSQKQKQEVLAPYSEKYKDYMP